ncbi:cation:proton antiporter domain-containing protein [Agarivorans sp. QJM3NY_33]|uniref:cation:proton antiporter domain-containing protein n=1 Tax=Agarivorans sp. QJM3NY_33 TaxID=3421432 RepID=UPI003D7DF5CE
MDISLLITITFLAGFIAHLAHLPPLIGFLAAGFILHNMGFEQNELISTCADLGVTLLLFTVGLKLDIKTLFRREVWGTASAHMLSNIAIFVGLLSAIKWLGITSISELSNTGILVLAFALCFSSTVFAVKVLEAKSEMNALYGRVAIGILIMQDIFAVIFLAATTGKVPTLYAPLLLLLLPLRPVLYKLLNRVGHGELQLVLGFFLTFVLGAKLFDLVGLKADLGALIIGMLLAGHPAASGMAKALFSFKELFLVAFFLSIGLSSELSFESLYIALFIVLMLVLKSAFYLLYLLLFRLRSRTSFLGAMSLANYSEFGLIVIAVAVHKQWLDSSWMATLALAVSMSFLIAAPIYKNADIIYQLFRPCLKRLQRTKLHLEDQPIELGQMQVVILGMGRIGEGAYDMLQQHYPDLVLGIDTDLEKIEHQIESGRAVIQGDATDSDFWEKLAPSQDLKLVLLAMPHHHGNQYALKQLKKGSFTGKIAAIAQFADDAEKLKHLGADEVFNLYNEAGAGFAEHVQSQLINDDKSVEQDPKSS